LFCFVRSSEVYSVVLSEIILREWARLLYQVKMNLEGHLEANKHNLNYIEARFEVLEGIDVPESKGLRGPLSDIVLQIRSINLFNV